MYKTLLFLLLLITPNQIFAQTKRVLVIAIGAYPMGSGWTETSALQDTTILLPALRAQGFSDIRVLVNEVATKENIQNALIQLAEDAAPNDIVWFHFSGHGQQMIDMDNDENDGLDEALIPYGASAVWTSEQGMDLHLRDEELGTNLWKIAHKIGKNGQLLVSLDACHSGSGTRGLNLHRRGTDKVFGPDIPTQTPAKSTIAYHFTSTPSNVFAIFAASPTESNDEYALNGSYFGSLTFALCKALQSTRNHETCLDLFERVRGIMAEIAPNQHPQRDGNAHLQLMSGKVVESIQYIPIKQVINSKLVWVEGGQMANVFDSSLVVFYPIGTTDTTGIPPLATGHVIESTPLANMVMLQAAKPPEQLRASRAYIRQQNFGPIAIRVYINLPDGANKRELLDHLKDYSPRVLVVTDSFDLALTHHDGIWNLVNSNGYLIATDTENQTPHVSSYWIEKICGYLRTQWLRKLTFTDHSIQCNFDLVVLKKGSVRKESDTLGLFENYDAANEYNIQTGDYIVVKVQNTGVNLAYFTLLDFQPDGQTNMMLQNFEPVRLKPGATWWSDTDGHYRPGKVNPPLGTELVKLFATEYQIDIKPFLGNTRSIGGKQPTNALEYCFDETRDNNTHTPSIPTKGLSTFSRVFQIIK